MKCPRCGKLAVYEPGATPDEDQFRCITGHWRITRGEAERMIKEPKAEVSTMAELEVGNQKPCEICGMPKVQGHHHGGSKRAKKPAPLPTVRGKTDDGRVRAAVLKMRPPEPGSKIQIFFANVEGTEAAVKIALDALGKAIESRR